MIASDSLSFDALAMYDRLSVATAAALDALPFGVIGFDEQGVVQRYNAHEAQQAGFDPEEVVGQHLFVELAPCMNNYLVAERFEQAQADAAPLDDTLPYVLTFRMRPVRVQLRLLWAPGPGLRYVLVHRLQAGAVA